MRKVTATTVREAKVLTVLFASIALAFTVLVVTFPVPLVMIIGIPHIFLAMLLAAGYWVVTNEHEDADSTEPPRSWAQVFRGTLTLPLIGLAVAIAWYLVAGTIR